MVGSLVESSTEIIIDSTERARFRVLLVDDEPALLKIAKQCLEMQGPFQVDTATSADEAEMKLEKGKYDVIISDYQMPVKDGVEFLKELRDEGNPIPFIMFTGKGREEVAIKALNLGANQYLNKMGETETVYAELAHSIKQLAKTRKAEEELRESEERFRNLFEKANDGLVFVDLSGRIVDMNQKAAEIAEKRKEEIVGKPFFELGIVSSKDVSVLVEKLRQNVVGESTGSLEFEIGDENGRKKFIEISSALIRRNDTPVGALAIVRDVTERRKAEEMIRESEERYRELFENARDVIMIFDLNGNVASVNKAIVDYGYKKEELIGESMLRFVSKEYWPTLRSDLEHLAHGKPVRSEIAIVTPHGKKVAEYTSNPIVRHGGVIGFQSILRDITDRRSAEENLRTCSQEYERLFDSTVEGVIISGADGKISSANPAAAKILGYSSPRELVGMEAAELYADPEQRKALLKQLMDTGSVQGFEAALKRRDETQVCIQSNVTLHKDVEGNVLRTDSVFRDISERENVEDENTVLENQQKFEGLFMGNPEATVYLDREFHILDVNPWFTGLFGYSRDEVKGKRLNDIVVPKDHMEEAEELDNKAGEGYVYHDTIRIRRDGSLVPVSISAAPIFIRGQLEGYIGVYKDISQQKNAEEKLAMMNEKLRVVGGLTRHDVRNKLSAITGNAYLARKELAGNSKVLEYLEEMETAVRQTVKIFDFAKAYEMLGAQELVYVDVEKTADEAVSLFSDLKGVKMTNDCHGLSVLADSLLRQLFYNLIDNSLKHGQKATTMRIHYEATSQGELRLLCEDDGVGIPLGEKPRLFKEGYNTGGSTGYGLYLIEKMMEVYGWSIRETGTPGKGAQFAIAIPKTNKNGKENYQIR
jgi:PAS domain S-box-containing protein